MFKQIITVATLRIVQSKEGKSSLQVLMRQNTDDVLDCHDEVYVLPYIEKMAGYKTRSQILDLAKDLFNSFEVAIYPLLSQGINDNLYDDDELTIPYLMLVDEKLELKTKEYKWFDISANKRELIIAEALSKYKFDLISFTYPNKYQPIVYYNTRQKGNFEKTFYSKHTKLLADTYHEIQNNILNGNLEYILNMTYDHSLAKIKEAVEKVLNTRLESPISIHSEKDLMYLMDYIEKYINLDTNKIKT